MTHKLHIARKAEQDRDEIFEWYRQNYSESFAARWYVGVSNAIQRLATNPLRCGIAYENSRFPFELRELLYGRSKKSRHRILFTVKEDTVYVLHIRHSARDEIGEGDFSDIA